MAGRRFCRRRAPAAGHHPVRSAPERAHAPGTRVCRGLFADRAGGAGHGERQHADGSPPARLPGGWRSPCAGVARRAIPQGAA